MEGDLEGRDNAVNGGNVGLRGGLWQWKGKSGQWKVQCRWWKGIRVEGTIETMGANEGWDGMIQGLERVAAPH